MAQPAPKARILVHVRHGPEHPTRAARAFLVARTAAEEGHGVSVFLAGGAVQLLRDTTLDSVSGVGTGRLRGHFDAIVKGVGGSTCPACREGANWPNRPYAKQIACDDVELRERLRSHSADEVGRWTTAARDEGGLQRTAPRPRCSRCVRAT